MTILFIPFRQEILERAKKAKLDLIIRARETARAELKRLEGINIVNI